MLHFFYKGQLNIASLCNGERGESDSQCCLRRDALDSTLYQLLSGNDVFGGSPLLVEFETP